LNADLTLCLHHVFLVGKAARRYSAGGWEGSV